MGRIMPRLGTIALLGGWLAVAIAGTTRAADRTADQIVADLDAVKPPDSSKVDRKDQDAVKAYLAERRTALAKRVDLIEELYKSHPDDARLADLMPERWSSKLGSSTEMAKLKPELDAILADGKNKPLIKEAAYLKTVLAIREMGQALDPDKAMVTIDEYAKVTGNDPKTASLMYQIASMVDDEAAKKKIIDRIVKEYPDSPVIASIAAQRRQEEGVGKPFELEFTEAIKGSQISMASLKGKVVVVDFWATWCGPCIAEMPTMKKLYAEYKDKGVEFVGVSLDQPKEAGGLDKLKEYVAKNDIQWPQYYQGNGWDSDFSKGWGVNAIPCVFLVDADGKLASVDARGKLETMIPEYLKKAHADLK